MIFYRFQPSKTDNIQSILTARVTYFDIAHALYGHAVAAGEEQEELFFVFNGQLVKYFPEPSEENI